MKTSLLSGLLVFIFQANAQTSHIPHYIFSYEAGLSAGAMNCKTDIGPDIGYKSTKINGGAFLLAAYKELFAVRFELTAGKVEAKDAYLKLDSHLKKLRNLSFCSGIYEASVISEIYLFKFKGYETEPLVSPYFAIGLGVFHFNPKTLLTDKLESRWIDLHPLHIDGQGFPEYPDRKTYRLTQINFPVGAGAKYNLNEKCNLKIEFLYRFLNTDYLDDVSEARTNTNLYKKYLSPEQAALAEKLYIRRSEIEPGNNQQTGPRGTKNRDGYMSLNVRFGYCFNQN